MTDTILKLLAFGLLAAFLGILLFGMRDTHIDLGLVIALTIVLAGIDFFWKKT